MESDTARRRIACLLVPDLVVQAERRSCPELHGHPFVVASGDRGRDEVVAASSEAAACGVRTGHTVAHARAACGELVVRTVSSARERTARHSLLDAALALSPRAELAPRAAPPFAAEAAAFLDASGVATLYESERGFASALLARAEKLGLEAVAGLAGSRFVAHGIARRLALQPGGPASESWSVLSPREEAAALASLPIDLLGPDDALSARLTRFGVRSVRDLLALPSASLSHRLGPDALRLARRARGEETEPPLPEPRDLRLEEASDLEYAIGQLEPLLFVLRGMLSRLAERLAARALAARHLDLVLELENGRHDVRRSELSAPTLDERVWLRVLGLELEAHPPRSPVTAVAIATLGHPQRSDQLDLFRPTGPGPGALDRTLAELEALCGSERVGAPSLADDHRPDAYRRVAFEPGRAGGVADAPLPAPGADGYGTATPPERDAIAPGPLAVRALRPPVPASVRVAAGAPAAVRSAVASGEVVAVSGPWRTTGGWWSEDDRYAVDRYDVQTSDGVVVRLCFDWVAKCWQIDAIYD